MKNGVRKLAFECVENRNLMTVAFGAVVHVTSQTSFVQNTSFERQLVVTKPDSLLIENLKIDTSFAKATTLDATVWVSGTLPNHKHKPALPICKPCHIQQKCDPRISDHVFGAEGWHSGKSPALQN